MKTSELTRSALDWAVAQCEGLEHYIDDGLVCLKGQPFDTHWRYWTPSDEWAQGGPIIEREGINLDNYAKNPQWSAWTPAPERESGEAQAYGTTPLIAAMRCYVASVMGNDIEVPNELTEGAAA